MNEHIAHATRYAEIHLFCASAVWLTAWSLTSIVRRDAATWKYWVWVATSLNFILPLDVLLSRFWAWHPSWTLPLTLANATDTNMFRSTAVLGVVWAVWLLGAIVMFVRLFSRLRAELRVGQVSAGPTPCNLDKGPFSGKIPVRLSVGPCVPAVHGFLRPHILLPSGIQRLLDERELNAVLIHELRHARRRDNLVGLIYEISLCGLWFHPFVWITGRRLALYRELSCDDAVIQSSYGEHLVYALAKLTLPGHTHLLCATASSLLEHRLARLTADQPQRRCTPMNLLSIAAFSFSFFMGFLGAIPQMAENGGYKPNTPDSSVIRTNAPSTPVRTQAPIGGVKAGVSGGIQGGVGGGVSNGVAGGIN